MANKNLCLKDFVTSFSTVDIASDIAGGLDANFKNSIKQKQFVDPSFQRKACWDKNLQRRYIDSILKRMNFTSVVVADIEKCLEHSDRIGDKASSRYYGELLDKGYKFISIDGQNRTNSIIMFFTNNLSVYIENFEDWNGKKHNYKNVYFKDLDPMVRTKILNEYRVDIKLIEDKSYQDLSVIFQRLQSGLPLNPQEIRNGMFTPVAKWSREISDKYSDLFEKVFDEKALLRMADRELVSKLALAVGESGDLKQDDLDRFYKKGIGTSDIAEKYAVYFGDGEHDNAHAFRIEIPFILDELLNSLRADQIKISKPVFWLFCLSLRDFRARGFDIKDSRQFRIRLKKRIEYLSRNSKLKSAQDENHYNEGTVNFYNKTAYFHSRLNRTHHYEDRAKLVIELLEGWGVEGDTSVFSPPTHVAAAK